MTQGTTTLIVYIVGVIVTFFVVSYMIARFADESPTEPSNFAMTLGLSLIWPITLPASVAIYLLFVIARMAEALAEKQKGG